MIRRFTIRADDPNDHLAQQMRTTFNLMRVCLALNAVRYRYHNSPAKQIEEAVKRKLHSVLFAERVPDDDAAIRYSLRILCLRAREELLATAASAVITAEAATTIKDFEAKLESLLPLKQPPGGDDDEVLRSALDWAYTLANKELLAAGISAAFIEQVASMSRPPMPTTEDQLAQTRKVTLKAGTYYLGDPCYMFGDSKQWEEFYDALEAQDEDHGNQILHCKGLECFAHSTCYGDGGYPLLQGDEEFGTLDVDAGCLSCIPAELLDHITVSPGFERNYVINQFCQDFEVGYESGIFEFGDLTVPTGDYETIAQARASISGGPPPEPQASLDAGIT